MICNSCRFDTARLSVSAVSTNPVAPGASGSVADINAVSAVTKILTHVTTTWLPTEWQGNYSRERATAWLAQRQVEGATLLVTDRASHQVAGLLVLHEEGLAHPATGIEVRLGYVIAERAWGKGYATEAVSGFVRWARDARAVSSIIAGVAPDHLASQRVLEKSGFARLGQARSTEQIFWINLRPSPPPR